MARPPARAPATHATCTHAIGPTYVGVVSGAFPPISESMARRGFPSVLFRRLSPPTEEGMVRDVLRLIRRALCCRGSRGCRGRGSSSLSPPRRGQRADERRRWYALSQRRSLYCLAEVASAAEGGIFSLLVIRVSHRPRHPREERTSWAPRGCRCCPSGGEADEPPEVLAPPRGGNAAQVRANEARTPSRARTKQSGNA